MYGLQLQSVAVALAVALPEREPRGDEPMVDPTPTM
jgi:hypothetical protein